MPKGRKSKAQEAAMDVDGQSPEGHVKNDADTTLEILRDLEHDDGPALLKAMAHFLAKRESFSKAKFADVANFFKLGDKDFDEWPNIKLPDALLPNSVFQSFCRTTLCSFANPGPISELANEAGMRLFLSGSFQSLVALFGGILCERLLPGTDLNKGGKIPANIFCQDLIIYVRELKSCGKIQDNKEFSDFLAQMMCELHGSWHFNRSLQQDTKDRRNLIPVFGCLRDARSAYFLSYDGKTFKKRIFPKVRSPGPGATQLEIHKYIRESFEIHQFTFALLLEGFVNATGFYHKLSVRRTETGDRRGAYQAIKTAVDWKTAFTKAAEAREHIRRAHDKKARDRADTGLEVLYESLKLWPPVVVGYIKLMLPDTIEQWVAELGAAYDEKIGEDPEPDWVPVLNFLTVLERRQEAVEAFWALCEPKLREIFEPNTISDRGSFETLAMVAQDPESIRTILRETVPGASNIAINMFIQALERSKEQGLWDI